MKSTSHYWRQDLAKRAEKLISKEQQVHWGEHALCILEQVGVLGFYAIRKLEIQGLADPAKLKRKFKITQYSHLQGEKSITQNGKEECYDLTHGKTVEKDVTFIEHQLTHSCYFESVFDAQNHPKSVFFTSDHQKSKGLYEIKLKDVILIFEDFSQLDIMNWMMTRESESKSLNGWERSELFHLRKFKALPIEEKFIAVEEMCEIADFFDRKRKERKK